MQFAANYSPPLADLITAGQAPLDRLKCPAWPDAIAEAQAVAPVYVHFPLRVGAGIGDALNTETGQPADWQEVEALMRQTDTPLVNLHLGPTADDYPDIPTDTTDPDHVAFLTQQMIVDVRAVVARFGPERVVVENLHSAEGVNLRPSYLPQLIQTIVRETGCGLLLDISHARLAAETLGVEPRGYIEALPVDRLGEIHFTGIHHIGPDEQAQMRRAGLGPEIIARFAGRRQDHLPMTDGDWPVLDWAMERVRTGAWERPWVVTFEYGGVGGLWQKVTDRAVLKAQIPRLYEMVHNGRRAYRDEMDDERQ